MLQKTVKLGMRAMPGKDGIMKSEGLILCPAPQPLALFGKGDVNVYTYAHMYMYICMYVWMDVLMYVCMHECMYACMQALMYTYVYTNTY